MDDINLFNLDEADNTKSAKKDNKVPSLLEERENKISEEKREWLYYTRCPLMSRYRDNLYKQYYSFIVLLSSRGDTNNSMLGLSFRLIEVETKKELRINDMESFLLSVLKGQSQSIEDSRYKIELEDFTKTDSDIILFINMIFQEGSYIYESGKMWFKDENAGDIFHILKEHNNIRFNNRNIIYSEDTLNTIISGQKTLDGSLELSLKLSDDTIEENQVYLFGRSCPFVIYKNAFYYTKPSYSKLKMTLFKEKITINEKYINDFSARVMPSLMRDFQLEIPNDISINEEKSYPCKPIVFLDYDGSYILAAIKYKYGSYTVDPYTNNIASTNPSETDIKLYRDSEKEDYYTEILAKYLNVDGRYAFSTSDDEKIFVFCYRALPSLQEKQWTFFYSEAFKGLKINVTPPRLQVSISKGINFFEVNFAFDNVKELADISAITTALKEGRSREYIRLQNGSFIPIDTEIMDYLAKLMSGSSATINEDNSVMLPFFSAPYFQEALEKHAGIDLELDISAKATVEAIKNVDYDEDPPKNLVGEFREYQLVGYKWIRKLADMGLHGVLADDMGLGKSFQTIATILKEKECGVSNPSIIVAPTSCVANWHMEIKKFAPSLEVVVVSGSGKRRAKRIHMIENHDVAIISYSSLRRDIKELMEITFNYVILDEAQHIKNANTQNSKTVKMLNSFKRLALTGTPIENGINELWSLFDFLTPGFFGKHSEFREEYEVPILAASEDGGSEALETLRNRINPFILRRLKKDVLKDLPEKHTNIAYCELTKEQKELYLSILEAAKLEIFETVKRKGFHNSRIEIFSALTRLRQVCCHPKLLSSDIRGDVHTSGKFNLFMEMIAEAIEGGHNIIVFSQFTRMLNLIAHALKHKNIDYLYLDGKTKDRMDLVNRFQAGEAPIFLLSLKAAGTGLTLTKADTVIHFDLWWNPAVEDQATDRAYRMGQKRIVTNYKLVTLGTIEEKILALQEKKRLLIDSIVDGNMTTGTNKIDWEEVKSLIE